MEVETLPPEGKLIAQGAEGRIYQLIFLGRPTIVKERFVKSYRIPFLDNKINTGRIATEAKTLQRVRAIGLDVPAVYHVDLPALRLYLEQIEGGTVKQAIFDTEARIKSTCVAGIERENLSDPSASTLARLLAEDSELIRLARAMGTCIGKLHQNNIVHGDLTTSNFMVRKNGGGLVAIDFGLSFVSTLVEDKAVDLYVLERAFTSLHPFTEWMFQLLIESYKNENPNSAQVLKRLDAVRLRGRKKVAFG